MARFNPYAQYSDVTFSTSNPASLVVTTYDAAIRALKEAARAMHENNFEKRTRSIDLAFNLVSELRKSLNPEKGGEIADKLNSLYVFFTREITMANAYGDPARLDPVITMMQDLRDAWEEARRKSVSA